MMETRRRMLAGLGLAAAGAPFASTARAEGTADVEWRLTSSFTPTLDLIYGGAEARLFPQDVMEACYKTANDLYGQLASDDPRFKKLWDSYRGFRDDQYLWWQVAEYSFDNFMIRQRRSRS